MTYPGAIYTTAQEYTQGYADGARWADEDAGNYEPASYWLETFSDEARGARTLGLRAYYLGVLRGYRNSTRTQDSKGRWGT
jgi:hypothetical protein